MTKIFVALLALVAATGTATAGASVHASFDLPTGDSHTVDLVVMDDGTVVLLLDGQPLDPTTLGVPALPGAPDAPALPDAPGLPAIPALP